MIQDNLVVAHEAFHFLKSKARGLGRGIALKLDMNKAYGRLVWRFLEAVLKKIGFNHLWVARKIRKITMPIK